MVAGMKRDNASGCVAEVLTGIGSMLRSLALLGECWSGVQIGCVPIWIHGMQIVCDKHETAGIFGSDRVDSDIEPESGIGLLAVLRTCSPLPAGAARREQLQGSQYARECEESVSESGDCTTSVLVLHASPLTTHDCSSMHPKAVVGAESRIALLSSEMDTMREARDAAGCTGVRIGARYMTMYTLLETLSVLKPRIMHLSGHGSVSATHGFVMTLERADGAAEVLSMPQLDNVLHVSGSPEFVFLSMCHSEEAARVFVRHGAKHVVACRAQHAILDASASYFTRFFWTSLFQGRTVREAFRIACVNVDVAIDDERRIAMILNPTSRHSPSESQKFILLPEYDDSSTEPDRHNVRIFEVQESTEHALHGKSRRGSETEASPPVWQTLLPSPTEHVVGRQMEIQQCVALLQRHRCVSVYGPRKFGKTSVAKAAIQFVEERSRFSGGIAFVKVDTQSTVASVVMELSRALCTRSSPANTIDYGSGDGLAQLHILLENVAHANILIVLDDCGGSLGQLLVQELLQRTKRLRVLTTSTLVLQLPVEIGASLGCVHVGALSIDACFQLLFRLSPWIFECTRSRDNRGGKIGLTELRCRQEARVAELEQFCESCRRSPFLLRVALRSWDSARSITSV